jgi:predicted acyltransferase (DUF342 family)
VVLLSSISYPGHIVGIRDITGDPSISARPIVVSTMQGIRFYDYSFSTLITQPNGYLSLSSKDPNTWQLLNTQANQNSLNNAYIPYLSSTNAYINIASTVQEYVSTLTANQVFVSRSIFLEGNTQITGSISVRGNVDIFSTLRVSDDMNISSGLIVGGNTYIPSSLFVQRGIQVGGTLSSLENVIIRDNLNLGGEFRAEGAILEKNLIVQSLEAENLLVGGSTRVAGNVQVGKDFNAEKLVLQKSAFIGSNITVFSTTFLGGDFQVEGNLYASSFTSQSSIAIGGHVETQNDIFVQGSISTIGSVENGSTFVLSNARVVSDLFIFGSFIASSVSVSENVDFFNTHVTKSLFIRNDLNLSLIGTVNTENLRIEENLGIGRDLYGEKAIVAGNVSSIFSQFVSNTVSSQGLLETGNSLTIGQNAFVYKAINIQETMSTTYLSSGYDMTVAQNLFVGGEVTTLNLAAPISLSISTLTLKNKMNIGSEGFIPFFETDSFPDSLIVGTENENTGQDLQVHGTAKIEGSIDQISYFDTEQKVYSIDRLEVSSIHMPMQLSSFLLGSPPEVVPFTERTGYVVVGGESLALPGEQLIWYSIDLSNWLPAQTPSNLAFYSKVATNGFGFWVAAGNSAININESLLWSEDGIRWNIGQLVPFFRKANDVVYGFDTSGAGIWVAVGDGTFNIAWSRDGINWDRPSSGLFTTEGIAVSYANGTFFATGNDDPAINFPYLYSLDGRHWLPIPDPSGFTTPFSGTALGFTDQAEFPDFRIVSGDPGGAPLNTLTSIDGGMVYTYVALPPSNSRKAFVYAAGKWLSAGSNQPSPIGGISFSQDPFAQVWTDVSDAYVNGLTGSYNDILYDSNSGFFLAAGSMSGPPTDEVLAKSATGTSGWSRIRIRYGSTFLKQANGIAIGILKYPNQKSYATVNLTTSISSIFSTTSLQASTIRASTFQGLFFGEGSALSNIAAFESTLRLSTIVNIVTRTNHISTIENPENRIFTNETYIQNNVFIGNRFELSTNNVWIAGGLDGTPSNILQYGESGRDWFASGNTFEEACLGVSGNGRPNFGETLFVAVGRDSRPSYTIQWSSNGSNWYPSFSGGFSNARTGSIKIGNNVVFNPYVNAPFGRWVAAGEDTGSNTILYSDDGLNWLPANNCFSTTTLQVATLSTIAGYTCYTNVGGRAYFKYSSDGINWVDSFLEQSISTTVATIGNGMWTRSPQLETYIGFTESGQILQGGGTPIPGSRWTYQANYPFAIPNSVFYKSPYWVSLGSNTIAYTSTPMSNWSSVITVFPSEVNFQSITYNQVLNRWAAGAEAVNASNTLWYSDNLRIWSRATTGGFTTRTSARGAGYTVIPFLSNVLAVGTGAFEINTSLSPQILLGNSNGFSINLTQSNSAFVFSTQVQSVAYNGSQDEYYTLVAVGDGLTPQRTIARAVSTSSSAFEWLPAVSGGFKKGYDVVFFSNTLIPRLKKWWAVGDFYGDVGTAAAINALQSSEDGLNWFGSNQRSANSPGDIRGLAGGARGIYAYQRSDWADAWNILAVGKGTPGNPSQIVSYKQYWFGSEDNGFWFNANQTDVRFTGYGNAVYAHRGESSDSIRWWILGKDNTRENTIQSGTQSGSFQTLDFPRSPFFQSITSGGFNVEGHGIVNASINFSNIFVVVGEDTDPTKTIQVCVNPQLGTNIFRFSNVGITGSFTKAGYGVSFNTTTSTFYAVGEDLSGIGIRTIKYSKNGFTWCNVNASQASLENYFNSEQILGSASALYSQSVLSPEIYPTLEFSNLVVYNNQFQRSYPNPTIRTQSTFMTMQETMAVNLNNQLFITSNNPYIDLFNRSTSLTVAGTIVASTIIYTKANEVSLADNTFAQKIVASSIINYNSFTVESLETPSLTIQKQPAQKNTVYTDFSFFSINTSSVQSRVVNINNTMFLSADLRQNDFIGIRTSSLQLPGPTLQVNGTLAISSLTTYNFLTTSTLEVSTSQQIYFSSAYLKITNNKYLTATNPANYIYIEPSSMTFNSVLTTNISTQKVGLYTENPIFDFDVQRNGILESMSTQSLISRMLFFTLQSV